MNITDALNWRFAAKRMNGQQVPQEKLDRILEAARLAPSSYGLQPYSVFVIKSAALREKIRPIAFDQPQISESSHLLVFAAHEDVNGDDVDDFIRLTAETQGTDVSELGAYRTMIKGAVNRFSPEEKLHWATKQAYISLGTTVTAAALEQIDASPMEGFDKDALDQLLGLKEKNMRSLVLLALGYRDQNDHHALLKKVRRSRDELFIHL
ncbi:NAD(P)H-dependent oxidoreductase [Amphritea balenae]|uniref:NAD(P)H-dependent oxidoreductase n=1 Tax=Amphritea balenae TaxID=452629 RepID=A0A3P1SQ86_9GAMM|nr:NAD(P)H-dependent oxidoreductase [Amphritea balenae]RRC99297.1 NAD(P)H-dependent oxidoreductase [Amphritea balenae]GGK72221.1 NAD(P)H-dependent oxidoreductase [Amphritea balenae]